MCAPVPTPSSLKREEKSHLNPRCSHASRQAPLDQQETELHLLRSRAVPPLGWSSHVCLLPISREAETMAPKNCFSVFLVLHELAQ